MRALAAVLALTLTGASTASAGEMSANACHPPAAYGSIAGEQHVRFGGDHAYRAPTGSADLVSWTAVAPALRGSIRRVAVRGDAKLVALTFDLCERTGEIAGYDGRVFDYLRREGVRATLFTGGKWMRSHASRIEQLMLDPLFEIASHSDTHRNFRALDSATQQTEIIGPQRTYEAARGKLADRRCLAETGDVAMRRARLSLFRFPFGACSGAALDAVNAAGLLAIQWDVASGDPSPRHGAQAIARTILNGVSSGSIVVMHANGRGWNTAAALPIFVPKLKALGYRFVTVSELLESGDPVIAKTCYDVRPGDTDRYDFLTAFRPVAKTKRFARANVKRRSIRAVRANQARRPLVRATGGARRQSTKKS